MTAKTAETRQVSEAPERLGRRLRLGMIGGGQGAFIEAAVKSSQYGGTWEKL